MAASSRQVVRRAVGIAALAPAIALAVLAVWMVRTGEFGGVLAGTVVAVLAAALAGAALVMTHAPVVIHRMLGRGRQGPGPEGGTEGDEAGSGGNGHRDGHPGAGRNGK